MMYYVARDGQQYGPYSNETIRQYLAAGSLLMTDQAREESAQSWSTLGQLFPPVAQTPAATPPPYIGGPGPAYAQQPVYVQAAYGQQPMMGIPVIPPDLHWALVWLLSGTGVFPFVWALIQSSYARKIDPASKATVYYILWLITFVLGFLTFFGLGAMVINRNGATDNTTNAVAGVMLLILMASQAFFIAGTYSIRASMLEHYNNREPIQLRLSGVMTFFFSMLYLQYHMSRIAAWKKTGYLSPQG